MDPTDQKVYKRKFEVGIIGLGNIGTGVAHYLFSEFENVRFNLFSRSYNIQDKDMQKQRIQELTGGIPSGERVKWYKCIDEELNSNGGRFLDSDIIIYAARNQNVSFSDFKERDDEFFANLEKIKPDAEKLRNYKKGVVIIATNPLEPTAEAIAKISGISRNRIIAASFVDTYRFRYELSDKLYKFAHIKIKPEFLNRAVVIGEHGPEMIPVYSLIKIGSRRFLTDPRLDKDKTREKIKFEIKKALVTGPTKFQTNTGNPMRNVRVPSKALVETVKAIIKCGKIPTISFSNDFPHTRVEDCFITTECKFTKLEDKVSSTIVEADSDFISEISSSERVKYVQSKRELVQRINDLMKKAGLVSFH
ncbi:hypothetical protein J4449_00025 [Candidatus Woesearchaeota archaeon]|nr:hypothetical protein [Candidatus Woesearchaeota archaeon]